MRNIFLVISVLVVGGMLLFGFTAWQSMKGVPASEVETGYMTSADRLVPVNGATVRIREQGPSDAPAIILIHGFTFSLESFDAWAENLAEDHRVIRYDLLGHGLTGPDPKERYAPQERAAFLGDIMNELGLKSAILAGNSLGGLAAWRFAATEPERANALILISPGGYPHNGVTDEPAEVPTAMKAYLLTAPDAGVRTSAELVYADDSKVTEARLKTLRDLMRREGNGAAMIKSVEEFVLPDPRDDLGKITAPTLILWGEEDILIPPVQGELMVEDIPNAKLITYPGVGHSAQEEAPALTIADVRDFLSQLTDIPEEAN